ncbi:hypothetical protein GGS20DRAFT_589560 [Poronia punctata]|nr:hypothetical protein GGS20DRAFT_589560 [Poronia punctata]
MRREGRPPRPRRTVSFQPKMELLVGTPSTYQAGIPFGQPLVLRSAAVDESYKVYVHVVGDNGMVSHSVYTASWTILDIPGDLRYYAVIPAAISGHLFPNQHPRLFMYTRMGGASSRRYPVSYREMSEMEHTPTERIFLSETAEIRNEDISAEDRAILAAFENSRRNVSARVNGIVNGTSGSNGYSQVNGYGHGRSNGYPNSNGYNGSSGHGHGQSNGYGHTDGGPGRY